LYSVEYQKLLEKDGVQTKLVLIKAVIHGYFGTPGKKLKRCFSFLLNFIMNICFSLGIFPEACKQTVEAIRDFIDSI
jgi:hypothetical protein